jgi:hypothetical protein
MLIKKKDVLVCPVCRAASDRAGRKQKLDHDLQEFNAMRDLGTKWDHAEGSLQMRLSKLPIDSEDLSRCEVFTAERVGVAKAEVRRNLAKLFDAFFTTKVEGVGLALWATKQIVKLIIGAFRWQPRRTENRTCL